MITYLTLFAVSFLAGSFIPLGSEAMVLATQYKNFSFWNILIIASFGNTLGGMTCYWIGRIYGRSVVLSRLRISEEKLIIWEKRLQYKGSWIAFFAWVPFIGEVIAALSGLMKLNHLSTILFMFLGKFIRYAFIMGLFEGLF